MKSSILLFVLFASTQFVYIAVHAQDKGKQDDENFQDKLIGELGKAFGEIIVNQIKELPKWFSRSKRNSEQCEFLQTAESITFPAEITNYSNEVSFSGVDFNITFSLRNAGVFGLSSIQESVSFHPAEVEVGAVPSGVLTAISSASQIGFSGEYNAHGYAYTDNGMQSFSGSGMLNMSTPGIQVSYQVNLGMELESGLVQVGQVEVATADLDKLGILEAFMTELKAFAGEWLKNKLSGCTYRQIAARANVE